MVRAVSSTPLRLALVRSAPVRSTRLLPQPPSAMSFAPLMLVERRPAPSSLIVPAPMNLTSWKSPYDRCAPLRSSSWSAVPSVVPRQRIGQLLSPAGRCLSISTVQGGAGACPGGNGGVEGGGIEGGDGEATASGGGVGGEGLLGGGGGEGPGDGS